MARLVLGEGVPTSDWAFVVVDSLTVIKKTSSEFTYVNGDGETLTFKGRNLTYDGTDFSGGRVTEITVRNAEQIFGKVTELNLKAAEIVGESPPIGNRLRDAALGGNDVIVGSGHADLIYAVMGNDKINGRGGNDSLHGMEGNDVLTGGKDFDAFFFTNVGAFGKDVVTDFDVEHEYLVLPSNNFEIVKDKKDTLFDFDDGSLIRLQGIKPNQLTEDNYYTG